jgi:uncharacterized membrane protein
MTENNDRINQLLEKLETLSKKQENVLSEIDQLRREIQQLKKPAVQEKPVDDEIKNAQRAAELDFEKKQKIAAAVFNPAPENKIKVQPKANPANAFANVSPKIKSDLEKFIGENLINKIGIAITVIGVGIGAKYSIRTPIDKPPYKNYFGLFNGFGFAWIWNKIETKIRKLQCCTC